MEKHKKKTFFAFLYLTVLLYACAPNPGDDDFTPTTKKEEINHPYVSTILAFSFISDY